MFQCGCVYYILIVLFISATADNKLSDQDETGNCRALYTYGYGYQQFFHLSESFIDFKVEKGDTLIKVKVQAKSDAHILLSPTPSPNDGEAVYEIVIGAGRNTFSDIRRKRRASTQTTVFTKDYLSQTDIKGFWIRLTRKGRIEVGKENEDIPFMFWDDPEPLSIKYISFCTWSGVVGKWLHDCKEGEVTRNMTTQMRLKKDLLKNYDPYARPVIDSETTMPISIGLIAEYVQLDSKESTLTVSGSFSLLWYDEKMQWESDTYDNLTSLTFFNNELWSPEMVLYNAVGNGASPLGWSKITLTSLGQVNYKPKAKLKARCNLNLTSWPWDTQVCDLQLGFWSEQDAYKIFVMENGTKFQDIARTSNEWRIDGLSAETVQMLNPWFLDDEDHAVLTFRFTLSRISTVYSYILLLPLFVSIVMSLSCFWISPYSHVKLSLNSLAVLILCVMMLTVQQSLPAPADHTPYLLSLYNNVLLVVALSTMVSVLVISVSRSVHIGLPPKCVCTTLRSWYASTCLCLPQTFSTETIMNNTSTQDDHRSYMHTSMTSLVTVKELDTKEYWYLLGIFLDRISFIVASIVIAVLLLP